MKTNVYINEVHLLAGITLKDKTEFENNNMALHICENSKNIVKNRIKLGSLINAKIESFVCANQSHSSNFHKVVQEDKGRGSKSLDDGVVDTDALYTYEKDILLGCFTADCVPVMFYNRKKGLVGVIHSGWQGTVKEITLKLFKHLKEVEQCDPKDFNVIIGPSISQEKFEVDRDVYEKYKELGYAESFMYFNVKKGKYHIDNKQTVKKQCELFGIPSEQIRIDESCTYLSTDGFSYRQNKKDGRHLAFVMQKSEL